MNPIRLMLVEDHTLVREGLINLLSTEPGIEIVAEAADAEGALLKTKECLPDVILMDIALPGVDGIEATAEIKREYPDIRVAMLTMHVDEQLVARSVHAGASAYLLKSATREQLVNTVRTLWEGQVLLPADQVKALIKMTNGSSSDNELTLREKEILRYLCKGITNKEIGQKLCIAESTVKTHLHNIYAKIGAATRSEAVAWAAKMLLTANISKVQNQF